MIGKPSKTQQAMKLFLQMVHSSAVQIRRHERWFVSKNWHKLGISDLVPWQNTIRKAINLYEQNTCIRFQENGAGNDYIYFNQGEGCYSSVGRLGGAQEISIGYGCETIGVICHEIGHSLGFWHEQARSDRDTYVK